MRPEQVKRTVSAPSASSFNSTDGDWEGPPIRSVGLRSAGNPQTILQPHRLRLTTLRIASKTCVWCQQREPQNPAHIAAVDPLTPRQLPVRRTDAFVQHPLPPERAC